MYLKSLTLKGFKSFADKTSMTFDPGLNVVVGPNGSGKSNVSDSILWVLGEQSAKMLRGQAMEDVIFSGSSARQPVSMAEVTIVLDNSDHTLPIDFDEVGITRRMYRSGESEYLINGAPARLLDIQDILHDSGLGKDTHSIISQGKLDSVLASRPEDRRELIEEAAGISKHRRRKERSERKLKSMDQSLTRAKDVQREITRQLRPLERQVTKAQKSHEIQDRLSEVTQILAVDDLRQLQAQHGMLQQRQKEADAAVDLGKYQLQKKTDELDHLQALLEEKGLFVGDLGEQRRHMQDIQSHLDSDIRILEEKGKNMVSRLSEMRSSLSSMEKQKADAARELSEMQGDLSDAQVQTNELKRQVRELTPEVQNAANRRRELGNRQSKLVGEQRAAQRESDQETVAYARLKDQISNAEVEDQMYASRISSLEEMLSVCEETLAERRGRKAELEEARTAAQERADAAHETIRKSQDEAADARRTLEDARRKLSQAEASLSALRSVDASQESASPLAGALAKRGDVKERIVCRLGDALDVPPELDDLVERLLGDDMAALVVEDAEDAATVASSALGIHGAKGTATIVSKKAAATELPSAEGVAGTALIDSVHAQKGAEKLLSALLGDVRIVDTARAAIEAHEQWPAYTFVTKGGVTVLPDGRCVVGSGRGVEQGALERKRRIRALEDGMGALEMAQKEAETKERSLEKALSGARDSEAKAKGELAQTRAELSSVTSEIGRLEQQARQAASEKARVEKRREEAKSKVEKARSEVELHHGKADEAAARVKKLTEELDDVSSKRSEASREESDLERKLSDAKLRLATVTERLRHLETRTNELGKRDKTLTERIDATKKAAEALDVLRDRVDPLHQRYRTLIEAADEWGRRLSDQANLAEADSEDLKKTIHEAKAAVDEASAALERAKTTSQDLKVEGGKLEVQVENAINAIAQTGAVLEEALNLPEPEDRGALEEERESLKAQLAKIGPVNEVAMDEYTQLKERADYIHEQVEDLESARASLAKITAAIERKMKNRFLAVFDQVNTNFQNIFAMLFPGGHAHIEMTDPDHLSETGIEVVAQPVGKRIAKMTLMSGGEKSLTALALLFAVYKTRTVPFYVFDEVEAALDESNLGKLLMAIDILKESTQLIVISHQRRTMEQADVLYGVSMQADGVSHVVSQRLDHATGKVVDA